MGKVEINLRTRRHHPRGVDRGVALVVVPFDVLHVHRVRHPRQLIEIAGIGKEVREIDQPPEVALEVPHIDRIKAHQRREQTPVRLGGRGAQQITPAGQLPVQPIQAGEQGIEGHLVRLLGGGKTAAIHPIVHCAVDPLIEPIDLLAQRYWIEITVPAAQLIKGAVEHPDDLGRFVAHDGALVLVPEHRHGDPTGVVGIGPGIELVQSFGSLVGIRHHPLRRLEGPALFAHEPVNDGERDQIAQSLEGADDQGAVSPGAGQRYIKVVAAGFGRKSGLTARTRGSVQGDPVSEGRPRPLKATGGAAGVVPLVLPDPFHQQAHRGCHDVGGP